MKTFDAIIIGGGLGGLTAGAKLAKEGKKICLLEQHLIPGGCATVFRRKEFTVEVGLHEMDGLDKDDPKVKIFEDLAVFKHVEFIRVPEFYRFKHGKTDIVIPDDKQKAIDVLTETFPHEKKGIQKFFKTIFAIRREIIKLPTKKWQQRLLFPAFPLLFPHLVFGARKNLGDFLDNIIGDNELKLVLQGNLSYYHDDPYSMSLNFFSLGQASYFGGGGYFIKGGSQQLSNYLAKVITDNGGTLLLRNKVEKIIMKDNKAVGVEYKKTHHPDDTAHKTFAEDIIANTAIPNVVELLPQKARAALRKRVEKLKISTSILSVYMGFKKEVKALGNKHYSTFIFDDRIKQLTDVYSKSRIGQFVFSDYSQIDSGLAPKGKSFGVICTPDYISNWDNLDQEEYKAKKEKVAKTLIQRLEKEIPHISDAIEYLEVATPKIPQQSGRYRLPNKSPIKNLYFASAWVNPGGGFTGAILSGWFCSNEILRKKSQVPG